MRRSEQQTERVAAAALFGAVAACLLYAAELVLRPYAQALASGEAIPYFARLGRGFALGVVVFAIGLRVPQRVSLWALSHLRWTLGVPLLLCLFAAVIWR
jgi:hypothetical protein